MTSYFSRFSPVPGFPEYSGPYKVGTIDVEIPVSELGSPDAQLSPSNQIPTVQYRIFYPCESDAKGKSINWLPNPQRAHISAYSRFLGASSSWAEVISFVPRILHYITIPVRKNAPLLQPTTSNQRWPVVMFSHGLGGSRNAYSYLVGSVASHGMIVIAPEHRDGSTPISYIREPPSQDSASTKHKKNHMRTVDYVKLSHTPSPEVEEGRNDQLKTRLWELGLIHDSLLKVDTGKVLTNLNTSSAPISMFKDQMNVHNPGEITFAGHSFGGATVVQFVKSVYYTPDISSAPPSYKPLYIPSPNDPVCKQITPKTPMVLLDCWCFPLRAAATRWLWNKPLPCYAPDGPGGAAIVAVESQAFYKWSEHLRATKRLLSPNPASRTPTPSGRTPPHFYYPTTSAHLSQSDFGMLFPWVIKKVFAAEEPERMMKLNVRAILQMLREQGVEVSRTSKKDLELEENETEDTNNDRKIFGKDGGVRAWNWLDIYDGRLGGESSETSEDETTDSEMEMRKVKEINREPSEAVVGNEIKAPISNAMPTGDNGSRL